MSDERRSGRAHAQLSAEEPSGTGTTIVGGQPPGAPRQPLRAVPVGIEKVLYTAAIDPEFRNVLLRDREGAIHARGIVLESSELAMLRLAPEAQLASAIAALDTSATNLARRGFMRAVAGAVTLAAGTVLTGCEDKQTQAGVRRNDDARDLGPARERPSAGIDPGYPPRDYAGMTDRRWTDAPAPGDVLFRDGPMPAGIKPDLPRLDGMPNPTDAAKKDGK